MLAVRFTNVESKYHLGIFSSFILDAAKFKEVFDAAKEEMKALEATA